jgi:hypothetical protein
MIHLKNKYRHQSTKTTHTQFINHNFNTIIILIIIQITILILIMRRFFIVNANILYCNYILQTTITKNRYTIL